MLLASAMGVCYPGDNFHQDDLRAVRAIRQSEIASEVCDIARILDTLFGIADGKTLLRGVKELFADVEVSKMRSAGGAQDCFCQPVPGNIINNYLGFILGLHARLAFQKSGHGVQTLMFRTYPVCKCVQQNSGVPVFEGL